MACCFIVSLDYLDSVIIAHSYTHVVLNKYAAWWQYFGGTNFARTAGGPFYITSYDYDAPIDEYGRRK